MPLRATHTPHRSVDAHSGQEQHWNREAPGDRLPTCLPPVPSPAVAVAFLGIFEPDSAAVSPLRLTFGSVSAV